MGEKGDLGDMGDIGEAMDDVTGPSGYSNELDELLGAYALDAVDDGERRRVDDYLEINPRAAAEVQSHREVATLLAFTGMDAPADLWSRISGELSDQAPPPGPELAKVMSLDDHPKRRGISAVAPWLMAAAAAAVIAFVAIGLADSADAPDEPLAAAVELARADEASRITTLVAEGSPASAEAIIDRDGNGFVLAADLPALPDGQTYQLWGVVETGDVISLGIFGANPQTETFTVDGDVSALAITIEQSPGVISDGNPDGAFVGSF
jgi:anti-sigma-K factor RskA